MTRTLIRDGKCFKCGKCCKELKIKINYRIGGVEAQYYKTRGLDVRWYGRFTILTIPELKCQHLKANNECRIYESEQLPRICMDSPMRKWQLCDGCGYELKDEE